MTRKVWTKILIVIVGSLWAYNIYRTVENYQFKEVRQEMVKSTNSYLAPILFNKDTFELDFPKTDPFLNSLSGQSNANQTMQPPNSNQNNNIQKPIPPLIKIEKKWPKISYFGFLKNHNSNHQLCLISINDKTYRIAAGEIKQGVKIIQAFPDSIQVFFGEEFKMVMK
jgi:hypothetical protein